jgi:beta-glucosidase-like glycosyl hydrolase
MFNMAHLKNDNWFTHPVRSTIRDVHKILQLVMVCTVGALGLAPLFATPQSDAPAARWVAETFERMTLEQKIGQLIMPSVRAGYLSNDSERFERLAALVTEHHVGGFLLLGGRTRAPDVLLNASYSRSRLGQPLAAASLLNRLQALSAVPLMNAADFETGVGFRIADATTFPRAMALGAANDARLAFEAGRITAIEARALGVHVNFGPVVDVNNNPRNPVINTRAFGENPTTVARLASAYVRGLAAGGMIATLKHFPGHGDTDVDSHLGLPVIAHPRARLDRVELPPFRAGITAGTGAIMTSHIALPSLEPDRERPTTMSRRIVTDLLRDELGFDGLVYTDSMRMRAVTDLFSPGGAAVEAVVAGHDVVVHSADDAAAIRALTTAVQEGSIALAQLDRSVRRILEAKARVGLAATNTVPLEAVPLVVGTRAHRAVAAEVSRRGMTLLKDVPRDVPLTLPASAAVLYLSVLDYPSGWGNGAPSRTFLPELQQRWPNVTAVEISDRTTRAELELLEASVERYDAVVTSIFVRTASFSGRMDLAEGVMQFLRRVSRQSVTREQPFVTIFFGNPYAAKAILELPSILLTYDFYDLAEASAVEALAGETAIRGHLPITLSTQFPVGHGLHRSQVN